MIEDIIGGIAEIAFDIIATSGQNAKKDRRIKKAAEIIQNGGLVAFPTETVYGLGADAFDAKAVERIYMAKGRPADNPLILHVANTQQFLDLTSDLPHYAATLMHKYWPGPLTFIAKKKPGLPGWLGGHPSSSTNTIGVRMPSHPVAKAFLEAAGCPVAAPSANKSGRPSPTTARHVKDDFASGDVDYILDGINAKIGIESTVLDITGDYPVILRPGAITREMIEEVIPVANPADFQTENPRSPGIKYRHYAPKAPMQILSGSPQNIANHILMECNARTSDSERIGVFVTETTKNILAESKPPNVKIITIDNDQNIIAQNLFANLRQFDKLNVSKIYAEAIPSSNIGTAIMDRMLKAAEGSILSV